MSAKHTFSKQDLVRVYRQALAEQVPLDQIDDKVTRLWKRTQITKQVEQQDEVWHEQKLKKGLPAVIRFGALLVPVTFISVGLFLLGNAVVPLGAYYLESLPIPGQAKLLTPIPDDHVLEGVPLVLATTNDFSSGSGSYTTEPTIIDTELDYTNLANWFGDAGLPELEGADGASGSALAAQQAAEYTLEIPKVDIVDAKVVIGGTDLDKSLIQYPGTADPGSNGAPVIFGHSVLRQFYNPSVKNPRRYVSIFSKIMLLKEGDDIFVTRDNVKYHYKVIEKIEVKPEDVYILTQHYSTKQLKLVTCTPEGTYLRRGVVTAQLVNG